MPNDVASHSVSDALDGQLSVALAAVLERLQAGELLDANDVAVAYPDCAELLRDLFPTIQALNAFGRDLPTSSSADSDEVLGELGDYRIVREIGRGGMGVVYEAVQISLGRTVALKVLPFGAVLDPKHLQRFRNEALAAANLDHPHIVDVLGVGCERGIHFYVMRYIPGTTLAQAIPAATPDQTMSIVRTSEFPERTGDTASTAALATLRSSEAVSFFRRVADLGIQAAESLEHAHQMGVVHRDIKPSNLLLDARSKLWVTDFGLAQVESDVKLTLTGHLLGTLRYMSPEQAAGRPTMVDHRTDIYSLGATLYELVTDRPVVRGQERAEVLREIAEKDPTHPRSLNALVPVDLETILLKCLAKEPSARYDTAQALADDLRRFLEHKPVIARRPSSFDLLVKWSRRHRGFVAAAAVVMVTLAVGIVGTTWGMLRAMDAEHEAHSKELAAKRDRDSAVEQEQIAKEEAAISAAISEFLQDGLLAQASPELNAWDQKVTVEELLDRAAASIDDSFTGQPRVEAAVRKTIGDTYLALGKHAAAQAQLEASLRIYRELHGEQHIETLNVASDLADALRLQGAYAQAEELAEKVLENNRRLLGAEHPSMVISMNNLAAVYCSQLKLDEAETLLTSALQLSRRELGSDDPLTLTTMNNLASLYQEQGELDSARQLIQEALSVTQRALGDKHPATLTCMNNLGAIYKDLHEYALAEPIFKEALELRRAVHGPESPQALTSLNNLASLYADQHDYRKAEPLLTETLPLVRRVEGKTHPHTLTIVSTLAAVYLGQNKATEAEGLLREAISDFQTAEGRTSRKPALLLPDLIDALLRQSKFVEVEAFAKEYSTVTRDAPESWHTWHCRSMLGAALMGQGRLVEAEEHLMLSYGRLTEGQLEKSDGLTKAARETASRLAELYQKQGNERASRKWQAEARRYPLD